VLDSQQSGALNYKV